MSSRTIKDIIVTVSKKMSIESFKKTKFIKNFAEQSNKDVDELVIIPLKFPSGRHGFQISV